MREIVILLGCLIAFAATCSLPSTFAQRHSDEAVINNFIARQEKKESATEYGEARSVVRGDLNGDGKEDAVVLYSLEGHSGTNQYLQYLAVFANRGGRLQYVTHQVVGGKNEKSVQSVMIKAGKIYLQTKEYLPTDPGCCPTKEGRVRFILSRGRLKEI